LESQRAARFVHLDYFNLPARDRMLTSLTKAAVVERMPKMKFIEAPQEIELVVWRRV
jgi:hypothetical protein